MLYHKQKNLKLALANYNKMVSINPNNTETYVDLGLLYQQQGYLELGQTNLQIYKKHNNCI